MAGSLGGAGALAGILAGTALVGKGAKDMFNRKPTKGWEGWLGRGSLGIATGGLSEVARAFGFGKKSIADYDRERKEKVINRGNTGWADYYSREGQPAAPDANIKIGANGEWVKDDGTWDPREYAGVQGNADTFGDEWFKLGEDQRNQLVTQFKDAGLYHKDKGDVLISDSKQARAREMFNALLGTKPIMPMAGTPTSSTSSGPMTANINGTPTAVISRVAPIAAALAASKPSGKSFSDLIKMAKETKK
jgi:hypothetical protein